MNGGSAMPCTAVFALDERAVTQSVVATSVDQEPVLGSPRALRIAVDRMPIMPDTPSEVARLLELSRNLLATACIHYEFAALADEKSYQAVEVALQTLLGAGQSVRFVDLIEEFNTAFVAPSELIETLHLARRLRNNGAHPKTASALPLVTAVSLLHATHEVIASLFDGTIALRCDDETI